MGVNQKNHRKTMKRQWVSLFVSSPQLMSFIFLFALYFFLFQGLTWLCWLCIMVFVSKGLVAFVDGLLFLGLVIWWESPPGMIVLLLDHIWWGFFLCLGLTFCRGFVIIFCEDNQILFLCMLRFNPFPRVVLMFLTIVRRDFATV